MNVESLPLNASEFGSVMIYQPMWKGNMKSRLDPLPGKTKMIKFPPPGQEKESNPRGNFARGEGGGC